MDPADGISIETFLNKISDVIINPAIIFLLILANILFIVGLLEFFLSSNSPEKRKRAKTHMLYGVIGIVIMISVYGIIALLLSAFGVSNPEYLSFVVGYDKG